MQTALATLTTAQIETLRNGLRMMALRALHDADVADDVAQEALMRALNAVTPECASDPQRLGAFVGGIARHVIADVRRRAGRYSSLPLENRASDIPDPLVRLISNEEQHAVHRALGALSVNDREILHASFFLGMTPAEVARQSGEPAERVRKRKSRALERLRTAISAVTRHDPPPSASSNSGVAIQVAAKGVG